MSIFICKELSVLCLVLVLSNFVVPSEQFLPRKRVLFPIPFPLIVPIPVLKKTQRYIFKAPKLYPVKYPVPIKVPVFIKSDYNTKNYGSAYGSDYSSQVGPSYHGHTSDYNQYGFDNGQSNDYNNQYNSYDNQYNSYDNQATTTPATAGDETVPAVPVPKLATPPRPYAVPDVGEYTTTRRPPVGRPLRPPTSINQIVSEMNSNRDNQPESAADMDGPADQEEESNDENPQDTHDQHDQVDDQQQEQAPPPRPAPIDNVPKENRFIEFFQYPVRHNQNLHHSNLAKPVRKAIRSNRRKSQRRRLTTLIRRSSHRRRRQH